ncbi:antibiotic resistance protein VanZ [Halobacteriales archaeon QS_5_70_17]|nr:MAG: antibiotic resistance protein VanZ [Halobacteriales archaeon QS_5_70_17]
MNASVRRYALPAALAAGIALASVVDPAGGGPRAATGPVGADKLVHAVGYAVLTAALLAANRPREGRRRVGAALAVTLATAFGAGLEVVQATLPARTFSLGDAAANALGALAAALLWRRRDPD